MPSIVSRPQLVEFTGVPHRPSFALAFSSRPEMKELLSVLKAALV